MALASRKTWCLGWLGEKVSIGPETEKHEKRLRQRGRKELARLGHWSFVSSGGQAAWKDVVKNALFWNLVKEGLEPQSSLGVLTLLWKLPAT